MLRLPVFGSSSPTTVAELVAAMAQPGARLLAGGTDLLPNLKHRLEAPELLVSIDKIDELREVRWNEDEGHLSIGAGVTLSQLAEDNELGDRFPSLAKAAGLVASPLIRNMATLGGNVNLDTRCRYVNQSEFWRSAIGGCLKSEGDVCHVVPKGRSCVAAMSSDCVPVLISLGAFLLQVGPNGEREVLLADYYSSDGIKHTLADPGEITAEIRVPLTSAATRASYSKWTVRKSIDFPLVSIAMHFALASDSVDAVITEATICLGVLAAKPKVLRTDKLVGLVLSDPATAALVGEICFQQGKTLDNVPYEAAYRRKMLRVFGSRALRELC
jgi:4-hydroxybenzoyl-CoA reductase subunit beta